MSRQDILYYITSSSTDFKSSGEVIQNNFLQEEWKGIFSITFYRIYYPNLDSDFWGTDLIDSLPFNNLLEDTFSIWILHNCV